MNYLLHRFLISIIIYCSLNTSGISQLVSGPMLGYIELRTAKIWAEFIPGTEVQLRYWPLNNISDKKLAFQTINERFNFKCTHFDLVGLEPGTSYGYEIIDQKKKIISPKNLSFKTQSLWRWRGPAPDFSFLAGSCFYANEPTYDRPGKPYGNESSIFANMCKENAEFMLWLGDNWYTREADWLSEWGLWDRASHDRSSSFIQPFLSSMGHIGIWDDHDYGPNDAGISYHLKEYSRDVFKAYMCNPSYGMNEGGIYTLVNYYDVDLFLLDNRSFRSSDWMKDSINGIVNIEKQLLGKNQLQWLKNALLDSYQPFKIIVNGSQNINQNTNLNSWQHYSYEWNELSEFIHQHKIQGVIFISGDKHCSEVLKLSRNNAYPLYDITISSLTAGVSKLSGREIQNPQRVDNLLLEENNYGRINISGPPKNRNLKVDLIDVNGKVKKSWIVNENELKYPK